MADIYSLLNLNSELLRGFSLQANRIDNIQTERNLKQNIKILKQIEEKALTDGGIKVSRQSVQDILKKVVNAAHSTDESLFQWNSWELRIISYYLVKLQDDRVAFMFALRLLKNKWKDLYFNGIVFFILNSWCNIKPELRVEACLLASKQLSKYQGSNKKYLTWKNHANYFDEAGPLRMLQLVEANKMDITQAPSLLGYKNNSLSMSFFSDVIIGYNRKRAIDLDSLESLFETHKILRTKKLVLADLVERADRSGNEERQTFLSNFINKTLGDVTLSSTWAPFPGATEEEALKLRKAMKLAKKWFARKIIESFFEICVQDTQRKNFWLRYVQYVSGFRIVGSLLVKNTLRSNPLTSEMFLPFFIQTSSRTSQTAALVLSIKDKVIIEFSDSGALYVYEQDSSMVQFLRNKSRFLSHTKDLKDTNIQSLMFQGYWGNWIFMDYGRMPHAGNWNYRLGDWMNEKLLSNNNSEISFYDAAEDSQFTARPVEIDDPYI